MNQDLDFASLGLSSDIVDNLNTIGFTTPTPIQASSIPELLNGNRDILGLAQTGTGKTASFALPIIEKIDPNLRQVQALILAPTRELAKQIAEEINRLRGKRRIDVVTIYGGASYEGQIRPIRNGAQVVVGTPGRVIDLLQKNILKLNQIKFLVLDEADDMLNMGFIDDIEKILSFAADDRRMLLFSATMPPQLSRIVDRYMSDKLEINLRPQELTTDLTEQMYYEVYESDKLEVLQRVIKANPEFYGIVFCHTKVEADEVNHQLARSGFSSDALHGDISQNQREKIVQRFRNKKLQILVATDVAARGVDIKSLTHVVNYSLPLHPESYVHRVGRTGRAGEKGTAISLVTPQDRRRLRTIQGVAKGKLEKQTPPSIQTIITAQKQKIFYVLAHALDELQQNDQDSNYEHYFNLSKNILADVPPSQAVAALLQISFGSSLVEKEYRPIQVPKFSQQRDRYRRGGGEYYRRSRSDSRSRNDRSGSSDRRSRHGSNRRRSSSHGNSINSGNSR